MEFKPDQSGREDPGEYGDWFLIEGRITEFHWARGTENLLESVRKNSLKIRVPFLAAAATDFYSGLSNSSMLAMYDGEDTQAFACKIDEQLAFGQFEGAKLLRNGDLVQAIVSRQGNALLVHAVLRKTDELLWLPQGVHCGKAAAIRAAVRMDIASTIGGLAIYWVVAFGLAALGEVSLGFAIVISLLAPFGLVLITLLVVWLPGQPGKEFGEMGSAIFRMFGFPDPDDLNMLHASLEYQTDQYQVGKVYMYRLALDAHATGKKIETKFDRTIARINADLAANRERASDRRKQALSQSRRKKSKSRERSR